MSVNSENAKAQMRKGVLELCILSILSQGDAYPTEIIEKQLKRSVEAKIPYNEQVILSAVNKGIPVVASQRDRTRSPVKELIELSDSIYNLLMSEEPDEEDMEDRNKKKSGIGLRLGR